MGRELASLGVNLLLGPDADVAASPQGTVPGDRGSRSFGGSPQWVGRMASRYIEGVHTGSGGRVATALGQFPGIGSVDRSPDAEAAVVDKPFSALVSSELVPWIRSGKVAATVYQRPLTQGHMALQALHAFLTSRTLPTPHRQEIAPFAVMNSTVTWCWVAR